MNYKFPTDFWWGSASSATQMEGAYNVDGKEKNIWDYWYEISPEKFHNNIGPKDRLNNEVENGNGTNNSKNGFENIRPKETDNNSDLNDRTRERNLVGKMENRTIGEYAKDKVKSSKFIDDLNRSYNLGKNSTSKWNIKNKKNKI